MASGSPRQKGQGLILKSTDFGLHTFQWEVKGLVKDLVRVCLPALRASVASGDPAKVLVVEPPVQPTACKWIVFDRQGPQLGEADAADCVLLERCNLVVV